MFHSLYALLLSGPRISYGCKLLVSVEAFYMQFFLSVPKTQLFTQFQVDHFFRHRMNNSAVHSLNYLKQFPTPLISIIAKFVSFVSGGLAGALIIMGFLGESILEGHVSSLFALFCFLSLAVISPSKYSHT
jgi:hypothetical protein